jgi:hypothetical protein
MGEGGTMVRSATGVEQMEEVILAQKKLKKIHFR